MSVQVEKWIFTVDEYHRMSEAGILSEEDRVELIDGEIVKMSPIGKHHAACVKRLNKALNKKLGDDVIVSVQDPVRLNEYSEPQPDVALLKPRSDFYAEDLPAVEDVLLIIEIADSSVEYDRNVKLSLYARTGIREVWLANLREDRIEAYSDSKNGRYQQVRIINRGGSVSPQALPNLVLFPEEIFG